LLTFDSNTHLLERHYSRTLLGDFSQNQKRYKNISPVENVEKIQDSLLILQGEKDTVVPKYQAIMIKEKVKNSQYIEYPNQGHMFLLQPHVVADAFPKMLQFLEQTIT